MKTAFAILSIAVSACQLTATVHSLSSAAELTQLIRDQLVKPGDELVWKDGVYADVKIDLTGINGKPNTLIVLRAETSGGVRFTGASQLWIGADYAEVSGFRFEAISSVAAPRKVISFRGGNDDPAYFSRLTDVSIIESEAGLPVLQDSKWVVIYGQHNRVDHCYFSGKRSHDNLMTVYLDESKLPSWHQIDSNYFADRQDGTLAGGTTNGWEIIRIGDSKSSQQQALCRVERNYFEQCNGEIEIISNKSGNNIYSGNVFRECSGQLTLRHGFGCLVIDNLFIGSHETKYEESGVRVIGPDHSVIGNTFVQLDGEGSRGALVLCEGVKDGRINEYYPVTNALVRANQYIDCKTPIVVGAMHGRKAKDSKLVDVPPTGVVIDQNVVIGSSPVFQLLSEEKPGITLRDNLAYTNRANIVIPWEADDVVNSAAFTVVPLITNDLSIEKWHARADQIRDSSGPSWRK
ncbi:polysaccharide lyase 6 family protein [Cerasicoccus arenae]|uniref:Lyase n=1 Tax=Cerasicoccus arenae TaxID=424488 RepID=A0A8J3DG61_9BACT|nr:polysaccharide lyase 6 family protein [Cerasicoccus arenae]MBK1857952.1 polysaccharide lyase 6 family protein [Cerasicoccus arenae]GHB97857.1 lyase [Cerasicoccus arenae]